MQARRSWIPAWNQLFTAPWKFEVQLHATKFGSEMQPWFFCKHCVVCFVYVNEIEGQDSL